MTIKEWSTLHLTSNGLWPDEASKVVASVEADTREVMENGRRWQDDIEEYPRPFLAVMMLKLNNAAVRYIEAEKPKHWAKPMFTGEKI